MRLTIKENLSPVKTINLRGEVISFTVEGTNSFMIRAYNQQNIEIGNMNVIPWKKAPQDQPTYFVKYTNVQPEYRKKEGDTESIAKVFYTLAQELAKKNGAQFLASDTRLSADSSRNWQKLHAAGKAEIVPDRGGSKRYRVAIKERSKNVQ